MAICADMRKQFSDALLKDREPLPKETSDVIIYWKKSKGTWYRNCQTMEEGYDKEKVARKGKNSIFLKKSFSANGYYLVRKKDNQGNDILLMRFCRFDGEKWESLIEDFYFQVFNATDCIVFTKDGYAYTEYSFTKVCQYIDITSCLPEKSRINMGYSSYTRRLLEDFFGTDIICLKRKPSFMFGDVLQKLYAADKVSSVPHKKQDVINGFLEKEIPDITLRDRQMMYKIFSVSHGDSYYVSRAVGTNQSFAVYQKVEDGIAVRREFLVSVEPDRFDAYHPFKTEGYEDLLIREYARTYITDKEVFDCQLYFGKWQYIKQNTKNAKFDSQVIPWDEGSLKGTRIHYLNGINDENRKCLEQFLMHGTTDCGMRHKSSGADRESVYGIILRIVEKDSLYETFFKAGLESVKEAVFARIQYLSPENVFEDIFGPIDKEQKSFAKAVGVPMFMLEEINDRLDGKTPYEMINSCDLYVIRCMKRWFSDDLGYLKNMDKHSFLAAVDILGSIAVGTNELTGEKMNGCNWMELDSTMQTLISTHGAKNFLNYLRYIISETEYCKTFTGRVMRKVFDITYYTDYLSMLRKMEITNFQWKFKNYAEIMEAHNEVLSVFQQVRYEDQYKRLQDKFDTEKSKWEQYHFSKDGLCVVPPKSIYDIMHEGFALKHCVRTYIEKVAKGETTILFIRKESDPDTPFFTLEIRNRSVRQCHGMCNRNVDTEEGLGAFIELFCKENKVVLINMDGLLAV